MSREKSFCDHPLTVALTFSVVLAQASQGTAQEAASQILAKLNNLSLEKRQKALLEGAKAEGEVVIYSSMRLAQLSPFTEAFSKRFPFLKVNAFRVSSQRLAIKVRTEFSSADPESVFNHNIR